MHPYLPAETDDKQQLQPAQRKKKADKKSQTADKKGQAVSKKGQAASDDNKKKAQPVEPDNSVPAVIPKWAVVSSCEMHGKGDRIYSHSFVLLFAQEYIENRKAKQQKDVEKIKERSRKVVVLLDVLNPVSKLATADQPVCKAPDSVAISPKQSGLPSSSSQPGSEATPGGGSKRNLSGELVRAATVKRRCLRDEEQPTGRAGPKPRRGRYGGGHDV